jgi:integrase
MLAYSLLPLTREQRVERLKTMHREGRLLRHSWTAVTKGRREYACPLVALSPEVGIASFCPKPVQAAIWLALLTGCRRGEICKIERQHIHADHIDIPAGNTKTLRYKRVPIIPEMRR